MSGCRDFPGKQQRFDSAVPHQQSSPPPIDTGANGSFTPTPTLRADPSPRFLGPRYSIFQSGSPAQKTKFTVFAPPTRGAADFQQNSFFISIPITYFFNPTSTDGYIHFSNDPSGVNSSSDGMIKNKGGVLSGKGTLTIQTNDGLLVIDLSSILQPPSFQGCPVGEAAAQNAGGVCFELKFSSATLDGVPGSVDMIPGCDPNDINNDQVEACPFFGD